ncbi:MAG: hypothetical protein HQM07_09675, partial [Zetaproteobacteria bacterium]|nr:hypothetical protein [Zetaproteobacteria bacterium]
MSFGQIAHVLGDPLSGTQRIFDNMMLTLSIMFPGQDKAKAQMLSKRAYNQHQAYGPLLKHIPALAKIKYSFDSLMEAISSPIYEAIDVLDKLATGDLN